MNKLLYLLAVAFALAGPAAALAQGGSSWVDPPRSIERPAAAPPAAATETVRHTPAASQPAPAKAERLTERRAERKPKLAVRSKPRAVRAARARTNDHLFARLFGPGHRGSMAINTTSARN